jgi:lipoate-protein ligase B
MNIKWLGSNQPYQLIHSIMKEQLELRVLDKTEDCLLLVEHSPTFTLGRRKHAEQNILAAGDVPVIPIERGGDVTFHGPGQLTGYPIVKLPSHKKDLHAYLRFLEDFWITVLAEYDINSGRDERNTGVWVQNKKMVAIGIACRRWVTWHGFACNVRVDLEYYKRINPCGMDSQLVTNMEKYCTVPEMESFAVTIGNKFQNEWNSWCRL